MVNINLTELLIYLFDKIPLIKSLFTENRRIILSRVKSFTNNRSNKRKTYLNGIQVYNFKNDDKTSRFKSLYFINKGEQNEVQFNIHMDGSNILKKIESYYFYLYCRDDKVCKKIMTISNLLIQESVNKLSFKDEKQSIKKHLPIYLEEFIKIKKQL